MMKPCREQAINLLVISVGMSPLEILTHQIDACVEQSECGPKRLRSRLGRERRHEVTLRFPGSSANEWPARLSVSRNHLFHDEREPPLLDPAAGGGGQLDRVSAAAERRQRQFDDDRLAV